MRSQQLISTGYVAIEYTTTKNTSTNWRLGAAIFIQLLKLAHLQYRSVSPPLPLGPNHDSPTTIVNTTTTTITINNITTTTTDAPYHHHEAHEMPAETGKPTVLRHVTFYNIP
jgi:hypothetical protein